jgi:outer membrane receptor for ferrienterochelin and colicins
MKILYFILFISFSSLSFSQTSFIKLIDRDTKKEIPYASVEINKGEQIIYRVSDFNGLIINDFSNSYVIKIHCIGYKTVQYNIKPGISDIIELEPDYFDLEQVTITGTRTEKQLKDVPVLTHIITSEQINAVDAVDIQDALSIALPNVEFSRASTGMSMKMQGLEARYILFLIDGEKIAGETNGNIDYSRFNSNNIERIEIVKGAASTLYGSNAIGGVVNIITKNPKKKFEGNTGSRYSLLNSSGKYFGEWDMHAGFGIKQNKIRTRTDFHMKNNEGFIFNYDPDDETGKYFLDPYNTKTISQKILFEAHDKLNFELKGNYYVRNREETYLLPPIFKKDIQYSYGAKSIYKPSDNIHISGSWYSDKYETYYIDQFYDNKETLTYANKYDNGRISADLRIKDSQLLSLGAEYIADDLFSSRIENRKKHARDFVIFLQDDINFSNKFNTILGFRFNKHSVYGYHFVPKISLMYKFKNLNLRANYGHGFKAPTLKELYMEYSPVPIVEIYGNPDLKPESSFYYSGSLEYIKGILSSSISLYQNRLTNMITEVQDVENPVIWTYRNINDVIISGIDLSIKTKLKFGFSASCSYSFTDSEDTSVGQQLIGTNKKFCFVNFGLQKHL